MPDDSSPPLYLPPLTWTPPVAVTPPPPPPMPMTAQMYAQSEVISNVLKGITAWTLSYATGTDQEEALAAVHRAWTKRNMTVPTPENSFELMAEAAQDLLTGVPHD